MGEEVEEEEAAAALAMQSYLIKSLTSWILCEGKTLSESNATQGWPTPCNIDILNKRAPKPRQVQQSCPKNGENE